MNKLIIPAGLVLGLLGGTAWGVVTAEPPTEAHADSTAVADSAGAAGPAGHDGGENPVSPEDADSAAVAHAADSDLAGSHANEGAGAEPSAPPPGNEHPASSGSTTPGDEPVATPQPELAAESVETLDQEEKGADQLARIFAAMQAKDAARVLAYLKDDEIREVLTRMAPRQAAAVLSNLDPDRAAVLSRSVLAGEAAP